MATISVIGAGLAGSECALQLADLGHKVMLYEMRPNTTSPVHKTCFCAELVCSNSFKSDRLTSAQGVLKAELRMLGSHLLDIADAHQVPAGQALAVDREAFVKSVTNALEANPHISLIRQEVTSLPEGPSVIATGPVTSKKFAKVLSEVLGAQESELAFFDAVAPIVDSESLDLKRLHEQSRYQKEGESADYLNAFLDKKQYLSFVDALLHAKRVELHAFEKDDLFNACQPIEEIAKTGIDALRFGPLKPKGLINPNTAKEPYAAIQLRAENKEKSAYNLVGFQTNLTFPEQKHVFSLIPGLENASFFRYGVLHKNTFINAPKVTNSFFQSKYREDLFFAGQITGTEGYTEAVATGLVAAKAINAFLNKTSLPCLPKTTTLGSLLAYATDSDTSHYQPMHVNYGLVPPLAKRLPKRKRYEAYAHRALRDLEVFLEKSVEWKAK